MRHCPQLGDSWTFFGLYIPYARVVFPNACVLFSVLFVQRFCVSPDDERNHSRERRGPFCPLLPLSLRRERLLRHGCVEIHANGSPRVEVQHKCAGRFRPTPSAMSRRPQHSFCFAAVAATVPREDVLACGNSLTYLLCLD